MALSPILNIPLLSTSQSAKETTINTMISYLERAMNDAVTVNMANGNLSLPITDFQRYLLFKVANGGVASILTLPAAKRLFVIDNRDNANVFRVNIGADTKQIEGGAVAVLHSNGTNVTIIANSAWSGYEDLMPAEEPNGRHTHWRVRFTGVSVANWIEATELEFRGTPFGPDLTGAGSAISSGVYGGAGAAGAFDNSMTTYWMQNTTGDKWIGYIFPDPVAITSFMLTYRTAATYYGRDGVVEYSDDGTTWFVAWQFSGFTYQTNVVNQKTSTHPRYRKAYGYLKQLEDVAITGTPSHGQYLTFDSTLGKWAPTTLIEDESAKTHRLWRLAIVATGGGAQVELAEVEFRSVPGTPESHTGGQALAANGIADSAFDGNNLSSWSSAIIAGNFIGYDFVSPKLVNEIRVRGPATVNRAPVSFRVEYSDDGLSWNVASRIVDKTWTANEEMLIAVGASTQEIPDGGTNGQVLTKRSDEDGDFTWKDSPVALPAGGAGGQVLTKIGPGDGDADWVDPAAQETPGYRGDWGGVPDILFNTAPSDWTFDRPGASIVALPDPAEGTTNALKFATITHGQTTWSQFEITMAEAGTMVVRYQVSTEPTDRLYISVDGTDRFNAGGVVGTWATATIALTQGNHIIRLRYTKDGAVSQGDDSVWIGKISFTETNAPVYRNGDSADWQGALWLCLVDGAMDEPSTASTQWRMLSGSISDLDGLSDVDTTTTPPTTNQALIWNGTKWVPGTVATTPGATKLSTLTDVNLSTAPTNGQALIWHAATSKWIAGSVAGGSGISLTGVVKIKRTWRHFRLANLAAQDSQLLPSAAEFKFFSPENVEVVPATASASSEALGQPAALAIDNDPETFWAAAATTPHFTADFGNAVTLGSISILSKNDAVDFAEAPTHWVLYGSDDGSEFFELVAMHNEGFTGAGSVATATIPETVQQFSVALEGLIDLKLEQLSNVDIPGVPADGQTLVWNAASQKWMLGAASGGSLIGINTRTANYALALGDEGKLVRMNVATANTLTVPANADVEFPIGTIIHLRQAGVGQTTIVAAGGVLVTSAESLKFRKVGSSASLVKVATNSWDLTGDLEAA